MNNKGKVLKLFDQNQIIKKNEGVKYSVLFSDFIEPFANDFPKDFDMQDVLEFAMNAWNLGNMSLIVPEKEFKEIMSNSQTDEFYGKLLNKMIHRKVSHFSKCDRFISDFELKEVNGETVLSVITEEKEYYVANLLDEMEEVHFEDDYEQGYINRKAIVLTLQQPFIEWAQENCDSFEEEDAKKSKAYLVNEEIDDLEKWLRKKFDKFFMMELEEYNDNKKIWPQKRNYKMFNNWFQVHIASEIYDLENVPVLKE
jgi:hypothetical protein